MSQPDTTKRTVATDAGHMENTVPAGKAYTTAKSECRQTVQTDSTGCCRCNYTGQAQGYQAATADAMAANVSQGEEKGLEDL